MDDKKDLSTGGKGDIDALLDDETFTGDELSEEAALDDGMFTGGELNEDDALGDETFIGEELGEDDAAMDKKILQPDVKNQTRPPGFPEKTKKKKNTGKWPMIMGFITLLIIMGALVGGFMIHHKKASQQINAQTVTSLTVPIPPKTEIWLKDFLIPLKSTHLYTCVTFSVVIRSWENDFVLPLTHEKQWLRGRLYAILVEKIQNEVDTPSLETFKKWTLQAVRDVLPDSHIISVDIHQFFVV